MLYGLVIRAASLALLAAAVCFAGCSTLSPIRYAQRIPRASLTDQPIPVPPAPPPAPFTTSGVSELPPPLPIEETQGSYDFVVPPTVTQVKHTTNDFEQYSLYFGRPGPNDTPFVVITVGPHVQAASQQPDTNLAPENARRYFLNGLPTTEWTGHTIDHKLPFCELLISHGATGDQLTAVAIAKTAEERKIALDILASIAWHPLK